MNRVIAALKATYNFFSGDAITLSATLIAFALGLLLSSALRASMLIVAVVFVGVIVMGLFATLWREVAGRPRARS